MDRRAKVELFEKIRQGYAAGETIQSLAKEYGVRRRMVRQAVRYRRNKRRQNEHK